MFKKTMTFDNLDGESVTQAFYFNYNKKEVAELIEFGCIQKYAEPGREYLPLEEALEKLSTDRETSGLSNLENNRQAYNIFQSLILDAYGVKEADNVTFTKTPELRAGWENHVAFVEMIFEFLENPQLAAEFIEKCLPAKLVQNAKEEMQRENGKISNATLSEMVAEAARRQEDPATRVEPGFENIPEAVKSDVVPGEVVEPTPAKRSEDLTPEDILQMDDVSFKKIDPQKLSRETMMAAFRRKSL